LLKGQEKITTEKAKTKLEELLKLNESLNTAYVLKEELRSLWDCTAKNEGKNYLNNWLAKAWSSGIPVLMKFATMLAAHRIGILNYFDHQISTGKVEGINNKIKVLKRMVYGYRNLEYFKLRIYFINKAKYSLI